MPYVAGFLRFWYDFIVGDDWRVAAGVIAALFLTARLAVWWVLPAAVVTVLFASLKRSARRSVP